MGSQGSFQAECYVEFRTDTGTYVVTFKQNYPDGDLNEYVLLLRNAGERSTKPIDDPWSNVDGPCLNQLTRLTLQNKDYEVA